MTLLKAQMNADLLTDDLKKKRISNESFWLIGQPDVQVECIAGGEDAGKLRVSVHGFDYYNTKTGGIESGGKDKIAAWLLDTDYDGRSLYPASGVLSDGRSEGGLGETGSHSQGRDRRELDRGVSGHGFPALRTRRAWASMGEPRSRSWTTGGIESLKIVEMR